MKPNVELIPIFHDNYVFLMRHHGPATVVDPGEATAVIDALQKSRLQLTSILITHHHEDHIGGIEGLKMRFPEVKIYAPLKNKQQIPLVDVFVQEGDRVSLETGVFDVLELPGHTLGHVGYHERQQRILFSGDVLFGLGCGRLFEGPPELAWTSLQKITKLAGATQIFCTHEYTATNAQFTEQLVSNGLVPAGFDAKDFAAYRSNLRPPTVPLSLQTERRVNPFLLCGNAAQFATLREARNVFRPK